jgi:hypothetical protein
VLLVVSDALLFDRGLLSFSPSHALLQRSPRRLDSVSGRHFAIIALETAELASRYRLQFETGIDGLDYFRAAEVDLPGHGRVLLIRHDAAPTAGTELLAEWDADLAGVRGEFLRAAGLSEADLLWMPE